MENNKNKKKIRINEELEFSSLKPKHTNTPEESERIVNLLLNGTKSSSNSSNK